MGLVGCVCVCVLQVLHLSRCFCKLVVYVFVLQGHVCLVCSMWPVVRGCVLQRVSVSVCLCLPDTVCMAE